MDKENVEQILEKLDELLQGAGALGEQAWPYLVRQAVIEGWCSVAGFAFSVIGCIVFFYLAKIDDWDSLSFIVPAVLFAGLVVIAGSVFFIEGLPRILNPEYYAIKDLLSIGK